MDVGEPPRGEQLRMPWCGCSATDLQLRQTRCEPCPYTSKDPPYKDPPCPNKDPPLKTKEQSWSQGTCSW